MRRSCVQGVSGETKAARVAAEGAHVSVHGPRPEGADGSRDRRVDGTGTEGVVLHVDVCVCGRCVPHF